MQTLSVIEKTKTLWGVSPHLPSMLRSTHQLNKTGQSEQSGANVLCDCSGEGLAKQGGNPSGVEITETSFYERGFE